MGVSEDRLTAELREGLQHLTSFERSSASEGEQRAAEWIAESEAGRPNYSRMQQEGKDHAIEEIGGELRDMMPFIRAGKQKVSEISGG